MADTQKIFERKTKKIFALLALLMLMAALTACSGSTDNADSAGNAASAGNSRSVARRVALISSEQEHIGVARYHSFLAQGAMAGGGPIPRIEDVIGELISTPLGAGPQIIVEGEQYGKPLYYVHKLIDDEWENIFVVHTGNPDEIFFTYGPASVEWEQVYAESFFELLEPGEYILEVWVSWGDSQSGSTGQYFFKFIKLENSNSLVGTWQLPHYEDSSLTDHLVLYEDGRGSITPVFSTGAHLGVTQFYWDVSEESLTLRLICLFTGVITDEIFLEYELASGELALSFLDDDGSIVETAIFKRTSYYPEPPYFIE